METQVHIPDDLYPQVAAASAAKGQSVEGFLVNAAREKLGVTPVSSPNEIQPKTWWDRFPKVDPRWAGELQEIVDSEFSHVHVEDWQ